MTIEGRDCLPPVIFEVGKTYRGEPRDEHGSLNGEYTIVKRTKKTVTVTDAYGNRYTTRRVKSDYAPKYKKVIECMFIEPLGKEYFGWFISAVNEIKPVEIADNAAEDTEVKIKSVAVDEHTGMGIRATVILENSDIVARCYMVDGVIANHTYLIGNPEDDIGYTVLNIDLRENFFGVYHEGRSTILVNVSDNRYLTYVDTVDDPLVAKGLAEHGLTLDDVWAMSNAAIKKLIEYREIYSDVDKKDLQEIFPKGVGIINPA